jgi:hypothetical protein
MEANIKKPYNSYEWLQLPAAFLQISTLHVLQIPNNFRFYKVGLEETLDIYIYI